ncbi:MAG: hypothetical protein KatS3mg104_0228 [Phycisphaerae bacterium]|jgi:hypothetical protein|nr:MAG: hypothetical protein KatS3mg104_0228 [Phycisphaerae bacterium]
MVTSIRRYTILVAICGAGAAVAAAYFIVSANLAQRRYQLEKQAFTEFAATVYKLVHADNATSEQHVGDFRSFYDAVRSNHPELPAEVDPQSPFGSLLPWCRGYRFDVNSALKGSDILFESLHQHELGTRRMRFRLYADGRLATSDGDPGVWVQDVVESSPP